MKLVRIEHIQCMDHSGTTFALVPSKWTKNDIEQRVKKAQEKYIELIKLARDQSESGPPINHFTYFNFFDEMARQQPNMTLADAANLKEEQKAKRKEWEEEKYKTQKKFEDILKEYGFERLWDANEGVVQVDINWGHRHGWGLKYGDEDTDTLPMARKLGDQKFDEDEYLNP